MEPLSSLGCLCLGDGRAQQAGLLQNETLFAFTYYLSLGCHSSANHGPLQSINSPLINRFPQLRLATANHEPGKET